MELDLTLKTTAALVSLAFAGIVLSAGPRRPANLFLAFFLFLIAGNQAMEAVRSAVTPAQQGLLWMRWAAVFAALDPFILYYFASIHPVRNRLNHPAMATMALLPAVTLGLAAAGLYPHWEPVLRSQLAQVGWAFYTAAVYTIILAVWGRRILDGDHDVQTRLLFVGMCLVTIPTWPRGFDMLRSLWLAVQGSDVRAVLDAHSNPGALLWFVPPLAAIAWAHWITRRRHVEPRARRILLAGCWAGAVFTFALYSWKLVHFLRAVGVGDPQFGIGFLVATGGWADSGGTALRWIVFGLLGSTAVLRGKLLEVSIHARRRAARAVLVVALCALALAAVLVLPAGGWWLIGPGEVVVLAIAVALSPLSHRAVDVMAHRLYGVPLPGDDEAALETYGRALADATRHGRDERVVRALQRLRRDLGVSDRAARVVERIVYHKDGHSMDVGARFYGRYRVDAVLSRSVVGRVVRAFDELLERPVILKELVAPPGAEEPRLREARLAGALDHPHVVTVFDVVRGIDGPVLVTEYLPGGSLADRVSALGPLPFDAGSRAIQDILSGLEAVHRRGLVHGDLTPANVFLTAEGRAKVGDFGAAVDAGARTVDLGPNGVVGTPGYMAPEQQRGVPSTQASDLYALGRIAQAVLAGPVPPAVQALITRATADDPAERWPDGASMRRAWNAALKPTGPDPVDDETAAGSVPRRPGRHREAVGLARGPDV